MRFLPTLFLALLCALMLASVGCKAKDSHGESTQLNSIIDGRYWYLNFSRSVSTTISPDLQARAGIANSDGSGTIMFGPNFGSPLTMSTLTYLVTTSLLVNNRTDEPGTVLPNGELFQMVDQDRMTGDNVGFTLFTKAATSMSIDNLVNTGSVNGFYHAVLLRFNRPGVLAGVGNATITKNTPTTASWAIDYTLSTMTTLRRDGAMRLAIDGAVTVNDVVTNRTFTGFAEENGDWIVWMEIDSSTSQIFRMDILIRKGSGMSEATLNGRFNLAGFYQAAATEDVDTLFGRMQFDGQGEYFDFTTRNSFGNASSTGNGRFPYTVASDGTLTFVGGSNPVGFITRNRDRRWFIFPDIDPTGNPASLGFFLATDR